MVLDSLDIDISASIVQTLLDDAFAPDGNIKGLKIACRVLEKA